MAQQHVNGTSAGVRGDAPSPDAYETYRLYQKDLLKECMEDARLIAKRALASAHGDGPGLPIPDLALALFDKRCEPWWEYRKRTESGRRARRG